MEIFYFTISIVIALFLIVTYIIWKNAAPYAPTPQRAVEIMIKEAKLEDGMAVIDIGCGDGRLISLAVKNNKIIAIGYELFIPMYFFARIKLFFTKKTGKVTILFKSFWKENFSKSDVIFCFLLPKPMIKLEEKFLKEGKRGAKFISYAFPFPNLEPTKTVEKEGIAPIYVYVR